MTLTILDDPTESGIGELSYSGGGQTNLPDTIFPRQVTLRDRVTIATLLPFASADHVPPRLLAQLAEQLNLEIDKGDTYPMVDPLGVGEFGAYWFHSFGAIMVTGEVDGLDELLQMEHQGAEWSKLCLGSFYIKPNWPGRSGHICSGGFLVTEVARNKGVGRLMGEMYLEWAPQLNYTYSIFNLVYESNAASIRIWDSLGFKRIGRIKGAGALRSHPDEMIDAIIYGRDLGPEGDDFVSEERFDKIRYYLKHSKYPAGADRAEKSRLRSAATHYKLLPSPDGPEERLMLKDKEVVADPQRQYEIARQVHVQAHGGINKTTASIAERYHWVRIKETVSLVIKNCADCKETNKSAGARPDNGNGGINGTSHRRSTTGPSNSMSSHESNREIERLVNFEAGLTGPRSTENGNGVRRARKPPPLQPDIDMQNTTSQPTPQTGSLPDHAMQQQQQQQQHTPLHTDPTTPSFHHPQGQPMQSPFASPHPSQQHQHQHSQSQSSSTGPGPQVPMAQMHSMRPYDEVPLDPQMMSYAQHGLTSNPLGHPSLGHPGMQTSNHQLGDSTGMPPGLGHHPMSDPTNGMGAHAGVDQQHAMTLELAGMGSMPHPSAFDLSGMQPHPGDHGGSMGIPVGMSDDDRMGGTADTVSDTELRRQLMEVGYGPHGHTGA